MIFTFCIYWALTLPEIEESNKWWGLIVIYYVVIYPFKLQADYTVESRLLSLINHSFSYPLYMSKLHKVLLLGRWGWLSKKINNLVPHWGTVLVPRRQRGTVLHPWLLKRLEACNRAIRLLCHHYSFFFVCGFSEKSRWAQEWKLAIKTWMKDLHGLFL